MQYVISISDCFVALPTLDDAVSHSPQPIAALVGGWIVGGERELFQVGFQYIRKSSSLYIEVVNFSRE